MEEDGVWAEPALWFTHILYLSFIPGTETTCPSLARYLCAFGHYLGRENTQQPLQMRYWSANLQETPMGGRIGSEGWEDLHSPNENIAIYWDWSWCIKLYLIHWVYLSLSSVSKQKHVMAVGPEDVLSLPSGLTGSLCTSRENSLWNWKDPRQCWKKIKVECHWALQSKGLIWIWLLIFNTAVPWAGGKLLCDFSNMCNVCVWKGNTVVQRKRVPHLHMQLFQD